MRMHTITKALILCYTLLTFSGMAKSELHVLMYFENPYQTRNEISEWVDYIYLDDKKVKLSEMTVYHNSINGTIGDDFKSEKGKSCSYKLNRISCDFDRCSMLGPIAESKLSIGKTTLYLTDSKYDCQNLPFDLVKGRFQAVKEDIKRIIQNKLKELKKLKEDGVLIFFIPSEKKLLPPQVSFEADTLYGELDQEITLSPTVSNGDIYKWTSTPNLSCLDCATPKVKVTGEEKLTLTVENDLCESDPASVFVVSKNFCEECESTKIRYVDMGKKAYPGEEWIDIVARSAGSKTFDILCDANCAKSFKIELINENGVTVYSDYFERSDVDESSKHYYHNLRNQYCGNNV